MFKQVITLLTVATVAVSAFAQNEQKVQGDADTSVTASVPAVKSAKGFRIALVKPFFDYKIVAENDNNNKRDSLSGDLSEEFGFSLGYADLNVQKLGFVGNLTYLSINGASGKGSGLGMLRVDGNLAYAVNNTINFKGGLNISSFTDKEQYDVLGPSIGLQFGVGSQFTKNVGLDVNYVIMQQSRNTFTKKENETQVSLYEYGIELALHATF